MGKEYQEKMVSIQFRCGEHLAKPAFNSIDFDRIMENTGTITQPKGISIHH